MKPRLNIVEYAKLCEQADVLESTRNAFLIYLCSLHARDILIIKLYYPVGRLVYSCQHVKDSSLSRTVWSDESVELSLLNMNLEVFDYCDCDNHFD